MANKTFADQCINGTFAEIWVNDELIAEATGFQAKIEKTTKEVNMCGYMFTDRKVVAYKGTGSLKLMKVTTRFQNACAEVMKTGQEPRYTVIVKLDDPASNGAERVKYSGVAFDDFTIQDFTVADITTLEMPFTFVDFEYLDTIE